MSTADSRPTIRCPGCGKLSLWKPELAGKNVRCKCGYAFQVRHTAEVPLVDDAEPIGVAGMSFDTTGARAHSAHEGAAHEVSGAADADSAHDAIEQPSSEPTYFVRGSSGAGESQPASFESLAPEVSEEDRVLHARLADETPDDPADRGAYGLAEDLAPKPKPKARRRQTAVTAALASPASTGGAAVIPYQRPVVIARDDDDEEQYAAYQRKEMIAPAVLIAVGLIVAIIEARIAIGEFDVLLMGVYVVVGTIINLALIFFALWATSKMLSLGLGEVGSAILKITAVAILPAAVGSIINLLTGGFGSMLAWAVSLGLYFALLYWFFDMDGQEMMICIAILWVVRTWIGYLLLAALINAIGGLPSTSPLLSGGGGGGTGGDGSGYVLPGDDDTDDGFGVEPAVPPVPATPPTTSPADGADNED